MNILKKLVETWRDLAKGDRASRGTYLRCASELEALVGAVDALAKFREGNGVGLPFGTIAWVLVDGRRYIREWHPMMPGLDGVPLGNWWPLSNDAMRGGLDGRFSEHEVSHYSVIEIPEDPPGVEPSTAPIKRSEPLEVDIAAIVGKVGTHYIAWTLLAELALPYGRGLPVVVQFKADSEAEAISGLRDRVRDVLGTFFESYKSVVL